MLAIQRKDKNQKGFTLAELLVVVAIIAVLVAVSIPIFTAKLEKAREATDVANMRAAKAAAVVMILDGDNGTTALTKYYNAESGKLVDTFAEAGTAYGKGTSKDGKLGNYMTGYTAATDATGKVIKVAIGTDDTVTLTWDNK